jgi:hypothetical protein
MNLFTSMTITTVFVSRSRIRNAILNPRMTAINSDLITQNDISRKRDIRFAITSILLNLIFLILNAPQSVFFLINKFNTKYKFSYLLVKSILLLSYSNHAGVFFINLAVNTQFQEELHQFWNEIKRKFKKV